MKTVAVECDKTKLHGMPIEVKVTSSDFDSLIMPPDEYKYEVKSKLINMMAEFIMENHLCEFTQMQELLKDETTYRCRAFLLTKDCIKYLRETGQI